MPLFQAKPLMQGVHGASCMEHGAENIIYLIYHIDTLANLRLFPLHVCAIYIYMLVTLLQLRTGGIRP